MNVELDHIILPVSDIEKSVQFYFKVLRLKYEPDALVRVSPTGLTSFLYQRK